MSDFQQLLIVLGRAGLERRIGQRVDERDQELVLVADRRHLVVRIEDLGLVQAQRFHDVLIRVRVDRLFKRLAQQVLAAFRRGDLAVGAQHDVVGGQRVGRHEKAQVALDDAALVFGQTVRVFPQGDVARHVDFLRHPVVRAAGEVLFPRPLVLERHQLVDVGGAVDDALVGGVHAAVALRGSGVRIVAEDARAGGGSGRRGQHAALVGGGGLQLRLVHRLRCSLRLCGRFDVVVPAQHRCFS